MWPPELAQQGKEQRHNKHMNQINTINHPNLQSGVGSQVSSTLRCVPRRGERHPRFRYLQYGRRLGALHHEGRLACHDAVGGAQASEDAVSHREAARGGRHIATHLGQNHSQAGGPEQGALAPHVGPCQ